MSEYDKPGVSYMPVILLFFLGIAIFLAIWFQKPLADYLINSIGLGREQRTDIVKTDVKKPLQYGTGLFASRDVNPGEIVKEADVEGVAKFPVARLASEAPMHYQQVVGHKVRSFVPKGEFFTSLNIEF